MKLVRNEFDEFVNKDGNNQIRTIMKELRNIILKMKYK